MNYANIYPVSASLTPLFPSDPKVVIEPVDNYFTTEFQNQVRNLSFLENDWAGPGSVPPSEEAIQNTIRMIEQLPEYIIFTINKDDISCTAHGTIVIDMSMGEKLLSVEVGDDSMGFFLEEDGQIILLRDIEPLGIRFGMHEYLRGALEKLME